MRLPGKGLVRQRYDKLDGTLAQRWARLSRSWQNWTSSVAELGKTSAESAEACQVGQTRGWLAPIRGQRNQPGLHLFRRSAGPRCGRLPASGPLRREAPALPPRAKPRPGAPAPASLNSRPEPQNETSIHQIAQKCRYVYRIASCSIT